jgi:SAM-dependent methyltransferase
VLGVDLSDRMLDRGRRRAADQGLDHVEFLQADAQVHPFAAADFDVVISRFGAMFFADPVTAFGNIGRAVRPEGRLVLLAWRELHINPWITQIREALAAGRDLPQPPANAPGPFGLADIAYVRSVLGQSGWGEAQLTEVAEPVYLGKDPDDAFAFVSQMGVTVGLLDGLDEATRDESLQRVRETLDGAMTDKGVTMPSQSWLIEAHRT